MASSIWWPDVETLQGAKSASRMGVWAAGFVAVVTGLVATVARFTGNAIMGIDAWAFVDAGIFALVAFGIYKMSRFAAVGGLCLYLLERIYMFTINPAPGGLVIGVLITLAFLGAVRGTFAYHKLANAPVPGQAPPPIAP